MEVKRSKADRIKEEKQRLKDKIKRYEVFLIEFSNSKLTKPEETINRKFNNLKKHLKNDKKN
jgi:selenocysteine-specific translation elongation factor